MLKSVIVLCELLLCAMPVVADNPIGRALDLNGETQYFEVPDSTCEDLANAEVLTVEIRFKQIEERGYTLLNKRKFSPSDYDNLSRDNFKGHGCLVDVNRVSDTIKGKIEYRYVAPLEGFFSCTPAYTCRASDLC